MSSNTHTTVRKSRSTRETTQLFVAARDGDRWAREAVIETYTPLARSLARRYAGPSEPLEDLMQVAALALVKAVDRFDPERGRPFPSYAVPTILGELRKYFRDSGWAVHVPRTSQERALKVRDAAAQLGEKNGRAPSALELAQYLELDVEAVVDALQALHAYRTKSLDAPRASADGDELTAYHEAIGEDDEGYELAELRATAAPALAKLPARDKEVLRLRFGHEMTQNQIADRIGVSQMQVSRILSRTLGGLQAVTGADQPDGR